MPVHTQLAALCHRKGKKGREVLLVTSSNGRWILPKGWPIDGLNSCDAAMVEAWEEAGVKKGKVSRKALGSFLSTKLSSEGDEEPCLTKVYAIKVQKTLEDYPESDRRDRIWVSPTKAAKMVTEDGLRALLLDL
ncbi:NUDIX hydrolase [Flavimaricola marinus]|nr:NUDIX hydrolase [Flavimaricola marinus]